MQAKGLIGLAALTAAAVIAAVALGAGGARPGSDPRADTPELPGLAQHLDRVASMAVSHGETKTTLVRHGTVWTVSEKSGYPADAAKLRQTLLGLAELKLVEPKTANAELYPRLEVEDPGKPGSQSTLVTLKDAQDKPMGEVIIGKRRVDRLGGGEDGLYVRKPGEARSWLARGSLDLTADPASWLDHQLIDIDQAKIKQAVLTQPDGTVLTIGRDKPGDKLALIGAPAGTKLKSDTALNEPAGVLAKLELTDVRAAADLPFPSPAPAPPPAAPATPSAAAAPPAGETAPATPAATPPAAAPTTGVSTAEYTTFDGLTVHVDLIDRDNAVRIRIKAGGSGPAEAEATALNTRLAPWVFGIAAYKAGAFRSRLVDLVEPPKAS